MSAIKILHGRMQKVYIKAHAYDFLLLPENE